jgi:ketosteroid isomerase-like protein
MAAACTPSFPPGSAGSTSTTVPDTAAVRRVFEANIDAIHKRNRDAYLSTYIHSPLLARNGPAGLQLGYEGWSARRDTTWPDTLIARNLKVVPIAPDVVYGTYCYTVTQHDTTTSGVSERVFLRTPDGWRIAVTTAFGLPIGEPAQCK